jgi:hypothetical protein
MGSNFGGAVNNAIGECGECAVHAAPAFSLIKYGRSRNRVHHEPSDFNAVLEREDQDRLRHKC